MRRQAYSAGAVPRPGAQHRRRDGTKGKLTEFFRIPREIRRDFWEDTLQHNRVSLLVICVMIFGMELFNMCPVSYTHLVCSRSTVTS